jgi:hypothetical protein
VDVTSFTPGQTIVVVDVTDVNEPPVFVSSHYVTSVSEGMTMGSQLFSGVLAVDNDEVCTQIWWEEGRRVIWERGEEGRGRGGE